MKKIIVGGILMFNGVILFLGVYIPAALYATKLGGWSTPPGPLGTALSVTGGKTALDISISIMICGICLLAWGCFGEAIIRILKKLTGVNEASKNED